MACNRGVHQTQQPSSPLLLPSLKGSPLLPTAELQPKRQPSFSILSSCAKELPLVLSRGVREGQHLSFLSLGSYLSYQILHSTKASNRFCGSILLPCPKTPFTIPNSGVHERQQSLHAPILKATPIISTIGLYESLQHHCGCNSVPFAKRPIPQTTLSSRYAPQSRARSLPINSADPASLLVQTITIIHTNTLHK